MKTTYQYRLRPNKRQAQIFESWLELCRKQYNFRLDERLSWWSENRCPVNSCSLVSCSIAPPREQPNYYEQKKDLKTSKQLFPEYGDVHSQVLQNVVERVKKVYERYTVPDKNGKRSGKPRYKKVGRYRSFTFPQMKVDSIQGNRINLPKIGLVKMIVHRPIPVGFQLKTTTIVKKAEHWYISLVLEDVSIPEFIPDIIPTAENTVGIDVGVNSFLVTSDNEVIKNPRWYRKSEKRLALLQQNLSKTKRGSRRRRHLGKKLSKTHNKIANQRRDFHHKTAKLLVDNHEVIAHEDLAVKNMSKRVAPKIDDEGKYLPNNQSQKSGLNKSIIDCGWSQFLSILTVKAAKAGRLCVAVNPSGTSQKCSNCNQDVPKKLKDRWHSCPHCGASLDRDLNAALNVKQKLIQRRSVGRHDRNAQAVLNS
ncbi:MAG: transposase [Fischerella sp.]|jgi:putative transposase|uniref:RNA-guided endonuclease InsQ/TnpB family protein n=1 Tax=Fischerella sp. TaxID=1191 RepID=UPI0017EACC44|nr:transposase [Fischerella sp.]NWF59808.1 transposase [Fischerella sp.]